MNGNTFRNVDPLFRSVVEAQTKGDAFNSSRVTSELIPRLPPPGSQILACVSTGPQVKFSVIPEWGDDLGSEHERYVAEKVSTNTTMVCYDEV